MDDKIVEGGYYAVQQSEDESGQPIRVIKVLKLTPSGVHVRLYGNHFAAIPKHLDTGGLELSIGHLPLTVDEFYRWQGVLLARERVTDEELEGYHTWISEFGDYFG